MLLYSQRDPRWSNHALGWGPALGTIGQYGCLDTVFAMIASDVGVPISPAGLDELFTAKRIFLRDSTGTMDLLPDQALDLAYPGRFQTVALTGYRADAINKALPTRYSYAVLWISTRSVPTHFVLAYSANAAQIADPWTGKVGSLSGYGGALAVHKTMIVTYLPPAPAPAAPPLSGLPVHELPPGAPATPPVVVMAPQPMPLPTPPPKSILAPVVTRIDKALVAFVLAAAGAYGTGQVADSDLTTKLVSAVVVGLIAALGVWLTPNKAAA